MPREITLKIKPHQYGEKSQLKQLAARHLQLNESDISFIDLLKKSIDARSKNIIFLLRMNVYLKNESFEKTSDTFQYAPMHQGTCHIIGFGPAGVYAALQCLELGIKPIVIERGKPVEERIKDIAAINKKRLIDDESNYCFGEGGAGTYSDGKLYTRSKKRGNVRKVLDVFIQHGADEKIGYEAHPHIGTNKLPKIMATMRNTIIEQGGEIRFQTKLVDFKIKNDEITDVVFANGASEKCEHIILATGHSARDIYELLYTKQITIEAKPFAMGVRIEHSQALIDSIQYKRKERGEYLPPASYSLVTQACGRGVFSFCMCPGGVIASAATGQHETVVNGWSSSARNGAYSNSGLVVEVQSKNWQKHRDNGALAALAFQKEVERKAFLSTGSIEAPAQRVEDFIQNKFSSTLPRTSYQPGIASRDLRTILPSFITESLQQGLITFGKKMKGYRTNDAILVGVESRSSSPVRIPRNRETLEHTQIKNLYPCGEGAGYAGGIVSAAIDGMRCAQAIGVKNNT